MPNAVWFFFLSTPCLFVVQTGTAGGKDDIWAHAREEDGTAVCRNTHVQRKRGWTGGPIRIQSNLRNLTSVLADTFAFLCCRNQSRKFTKKLFQYVFRKMKLAFSYLSFSWGLRVCFMQVVRVAFIPSPLPPAKHRFGKRVLSYTTSTLRSREIEWGDHAIEGGGVYKEKKRRRNRDLINCFDCVLCGRGGGRKKSSIEMFSSFSFGVMIDFLPISQPNPSSSSITRKRKWDELLLTHSFWIWIGYETSCERWETVVSLHRRVLSQRVMKHDSLHYPNERQETDKKGTGN